MRVQGIGFAVDGGLVTVDLPQRVCELVGEYARPWVGSIEDAAQLAAVLRDFQEHSPGTMPEMDTLLERAATRVELAAAIAALVRAWP